MTYQHPNPTSLSIEFTEKVAPDDAEILVGYPVAFLNTQVLKGALKDAFNITAWAKSGYGGTSFFIDQEIPACEAKVSISLKHLSTPDLEKKMERVIDAVKNLYTPMRGQD